MNDGSAAEIKKEGLKNKIDSVSEIDEIHNSCRMDQAWHKILAIKNSNGSPKYKFLWNFMLTILLRPHRIAACENLNYYII